MTPAPLVAWAVFAMTATSMFIGYVNAMHSRIHPLFSDGFLASTPINDSRLFATVEIVLAREGHIVKMGVVKPSGVAAFDAGALDSVQRASPFGEAPVAILSSDGNVHIQWDFHRDEVLACSRWWPFILDLGAR
jgi:TonB family protein